MAIVASWSGVGLADGTAVGTSTAGTGDTPFDTVTGGAFEVDASGLNSPRIQADQAAGVEAQLIWSTAVLGTLSTHAVRVYAELSAHPPGNGRILAAHDAANGLMWWLDVTSAGILRLRDPGGSAVDTSAAALPTATELRLEVVGDGTGTVTATVYLGNSTTPWDTLTGPGFGTDVEQLRVLNPNTSPTWPTVHLDEIAVSDTAAEIGPVVGPIPSGGGTLTATATLTGTGQKTGIGGGTLTATATLTGTGENITPTPPAFPNAPLDLRTELYVGGQWVNTIDKALVRDPVTITRGRSNEASRADPCKAKVSVRDLDGKWSNRNPRSPYFGLLSRNTPLRVRVGDPPPYAYLPGLRDHHLSTPDTAALDITGDLDVRADITPDSWRPDADTVIASRYLIAGDQRSWALHLTSRGALELIWSSDGTSAARTFVSSAAVIAESSQRLAVRAVLDVDNGAAGNTVTFYTALTLDGPWTPLGDPVTTPGTSSVFAGSADLEIGTADGGQVAITGTRYLHGRVHAVQLLDGIDGPVAADPGIADLDESDLTIHEPDLDERTITWTGADGQAWTLHGTARLLWPGRFYGEVASWPPSWHVSGGDVRVALQAAGIRRRLGQGVAPIQSTLRRSIPADWAAVAYWPMEDAGGHFASAIPTAPVLRLNRNASSIDYQADDEFVGSAPLPHLGTGRLVGGVLPYTPVPEDTNPAILTTQVVTLLLHAPDSALSGARSLIKLSTTGSAARVDLWYSTSGGGQLAVTIYDRDGAKQDEQVTGLTVAGKLLRVALTLTQRTTGVDWNVETLEQGDPESWQSVGFGISGPWTYGRITAATVGDTADLGGTTIGHVTVYSRRTLLLDLETQFNGFAGENAAERLTRLAAENVVPLTIVGQLGETAAMGPQRVGTLLELLDEAADADGGILHESRDEAGFEYRTRTSLYNQDRRVVLDYTARGEVPPPLTPVEDDQAIRNDVTATREGGSSARFVREDGPLSVQAPPNGVGTYDEEVTLNLAADEQLLDVAAWRVHLGTWDEARYPTVVMWPHTAAQHLDDIASMDVGDRFAVTNPPTWLPPADIDQLAQGYTEVLKPWSWEIKVNASPAGPWDVAAVDDARADTDGTALVDAVDETATELMVTSTAGPYWTTDPDDMPVDLAVGGEVVTASAITDGVVDDFDRTEVAGWGSSGGRAWTVFGGAADFSVDPTDGAQIAFGAVNVAKIAALDLSEPAGVDFEVTFRSPAAAITGAAVYVYLLGYFDQVDFSGYQLRIGLHPDGTVRAGIEFRSSDFSPATLITPEKIISGVTVNGVDSYRARLKIQAFLIAGRVWVDGDPEPDAWQVTTWDASYTPGDVGVQVFVPADVTNALPLTVPFGELVIHNPQKMTVTRSINGIVKPHSARAAVELADPSQIAL